MNLSLKEQTILDSIIVWSDNNPLLPEFPPDEPKFPATPTYQIQVPWFTNVRIKDESFNATGTHKDRMAREIVVTYRDFLLAKKNWQISNLPIMSLISSWSAAFAIQNQLKRYGLPNLHVLIDHTLSSSSIEKLESIWCEIFITDLHKKPLSSKDILFLTHNPNWFDITSSDALDPTTRFYDWLSYEIINSSPEYCFIPFGTGNLFENVLNVNKKEITATNHDPRFNWNIHILRTCNFFWATTNNPSSKATKLYSPHLPFIHYDEQWIKFYKSAWFCWNQSDVEAIHEYYLEQALKIAYDQNINCEPSWIAWLALLLQKQNQINPDKKVLIVNTGKSHCS